jgi:hypothetical protein
MEAGLRTPLLDFFRRGDVARDVRMLAAQGAFAPRALEQLGLLMLLTSDQDTDIRHTAEATLSSIPADVLAGFIARSDVPADLRDFFVQRGIAVAATPLSNPPEALIDRDDEDYGPEPSTEDEKLSMVQRLSRMSVPEKVRAAMKGSREMRSALVRDPNKLVALAVLSSPKLTDAEVEAFCKMGSVTEEVLRVIGMSRAWTKNYGVILSLVKNPKTPLAISLPMLNRINEGDVKRLASDRNIPEALRTAVRRRIANI